MQTAFKLKKNLAWKVQARVYKSCMGIGANVSLAWVA